MPNRLSRVFGSLAGTISQLDLEIGRLARAFDLLDLAMQRERLQSRK
jgi:hypothetical protein